MGLNIARGLTALAITTLPLASLTLTFSVVGADAVYAGNGNGGGNGNGNGNRGGRSSDRGDHASENRGNGHGNSQDHGRGRSAEGQGHGNGATASELKGLSACHASDQARANADPDSQVGRIATYGTAAEQSETALDGWNTAKGEYDELLAAYEAGRTSAEIQIAVDTLDPASESYEGDRATLEAELAQTQADEAELHERAVDLNDKAAAYEAAAEQERTALSAASGGRELSEEAAAALRSCLEG